MRIFQLKFPVQWVLCVLTQNDRCAMVFQSDLKFLGKCWKLAGRPTFCMIIREDNIR